MPIITEPYQKRTRKPPKKERMREALKNPLLIQKEKMRRSYYEFFKFFWSELSDDQFKDNWHIKILCNELQEIAERVGNNEKRKHDLIINIPPGMTKTKTCSIAFPIWCWTRWYWMRFITASYSGSLSLENAEQSRDLIRSERFNMVYPEIEIKQDKDTKSNFRVVKKLPNVGTTNGSRLPKTKAGGNRYSTSVGGTVTGFHGHIIIWDDPLNPYEAVSETELYNANRWLDQVISTRKTDKQVSTTIGIMQRLHQNDPTGHILNKKKSNVKNISLPGEIRNYPEQVQPKELKEYYADDLLDPVRLDWEVLADLEADLGQYGYAGQVGQNPTPPGGGMFKVNMFIMLQAMVANVNIVETVRYWDKAGTKEKADGKPGGAYTVGVKMHKLNSGKYIISDVKRGHWESNEREKIIRATAEADGPLVKIYHEQEPGSGGKESAEATTRNLSGFMAEADRPQGDKVYRADPYSVQVNNGNVLLLKGDWNSPFIEEHRNFPFSTTKDQVDAAGGAFTKLAGKKRVKLL